MIPCRAVMASRGIGHRLLMAAGQSRGQVVLSHVRQFHFSPRRQIPPIMWMIVKPVMKVGAALTGRVFRKKWKNWTPEQKSLVWTRMKKNWPVFAVVGCLSGTCGWYYGRSHMVPAPVTGRMRFISVTHDQLMKISNAEVQVTLDTYQEKLLPVSSKVTQGVLKVATRLVSCNPELQNMHVEKWKVTVIDEDQMNAFVVPNGHIFVFTGLLDIAQNEDQLAMVLGHEMAHALLSHSAEKLSVSQILDVTIITVMAAIWTVMPNDGIAVITNWFYHKVIDLMLHLPYSRTLEKEADKVGMHLAAKACYDVREGSVFWKHLEILESTSDEPNPEWLSTHPAHGKRVAHLDHLVPEATKLREECSCPALPQLDPRTRSISLEKHVNNTLTAKRAGQNLRKVSVKQGI